LSNLVIRAPNHLGDFVMALPAMQAANPEAVVVARWLASLAELAGFETIALAPGPGGFAAAVIEIRRRAFGRGILLTPSFSSALLFRLGGVRLRRGTNTDGRSFLLTSAIDRSLLELQHRASAYMAITKNDVPAERPSPRLTIPVSAKSQFENLVRRQGPFIGVCPGSHAPSRTWPVERFAEVAGRLAATATVLVFGSPAERKTTRLVAGDWAIDLGGKTDLPVLAAGLAACSLVISNDSGPLHLAAAVGAPTISFWGAGDPSRTGPPSGHRMLRADNLPCLECVKNQCPRRGEGYILPDAYNECLQLIGVSDVINAAQVTVSNDERTGR
jgi:heptosyltransferase-2